MTGLPPARGQQTHTYQPPQHIIQRCQDLAKHTYMFLYVFCHTLSVRVRLARVQMAGRTLILLYVGSTILVDARRKPGLTPSQARTRCCKG